VDKSGRHGQRSGSRHPSGGCLRAAHHREVDSYDEITNVEKLNDKIDLVAEGVQANTEILNRQAEESRREREEIRTVHGAAIQHLERRVTRHDDDVGQLDRRVGVLEAARA